jgi:hypothetical protein
MSNEDIDYTRLEYGCYVLNHEGSLNENMRYTTAEFTRLYARRLRLPDGAGNVIYLLTDTFDNALEMISSKMFITPPTYRKFYYPWILFGSFMKRRFRLNVIKKHIERKKLIKEKLKSIRPYPTRVLMKSKENIFFDTSDIYETVLPILEKFPVKKGFNEFYKEFDEIITRLTPPVDKPVEDKNFNNRIMIIDADAFAFKQGATVNENKTNPLFLLYLAFLRTRSLSVIGIDRDMVICSRNMFMKFNPIKVNQAVWGKFRAALFRIMKANLDNYVDQLSDKEKQEIELTSNDHLTAAIVDDTIKQHTKYVSPVTKGVLADAIDNNIRQQALTTDAIAKVVSHEQDTISKSISGKPLPPKPLQEPVKTSILNTNPYDAISQQKQKLFDAIIKDYRPLAIRVDSEEPTEEEIETIDDYADEIHDDVSELMNNDSVKEEVLDEIQDRVAPLNNPDTAPINSARDKKLREKQKKIVVRNSTIGEILERDARNTPIQSDNKSSVLKTTNQNMHNITFANFDKTYIEQLYTKDILSCFDMLKDKSHPFIITGITINDSSDSLNLKETWSVHLVSETGVRSTMKVDVPKFYQNRFMWLNGSKWIVLKQNFYNPIVKDGPDRLFITTNYNKITVTRKATKSIDTVEKIFSLVKKVNDTEVFTAGDSRKENVDMRLISSLEYDELSRRIFKYSSNGCEIYFSRKYIQEKMTDKLPKSIGKNEFFIGLEKNTPILINENTGLDRNGRSITEIIIQNLSPDYQAMYKTVKSTKQPMFVQATIANEDIPVIVVLLVWVGLSNTLSKMGMKWEFHPNAKSIPKNSTSNYIKFADGVLEYEKQIHAELILNGLNKLDNMTRFKFKDYDTEDPYIDYLHSLFGNHSGSTQLKTFHEFLIDPVTKEVCEDLMLPSTADELLIYAVKLLADNKHVSKADDRSYRLRSIEQISAVLYSLVTSQYKDHVASGGKKPMTLNQDILLKRIMDQKKSGLNKDEYSTLNPVVEVARMHSISAKGVRGSNSDRAYDEEKRSYDESSVGKISMSTSPDANVGVSREIVIEPTLTNARGHRQQVDDTETLKDVNLFSPVELLTPGCIRHDDGIRSAINLLSL